MSILQSHLNPKSSKTSRKNFCIGSGKYAGADLSLAGGLVIEDISANSLKLFLN
ncbi:MAG: hypothetical protein IPG99_08040 [Ignavibacteria bacterium]|nr:hypothetical protein [Ignavibacteria bacterium]